LLAEAQSERDLMHLADQPLYRVKRSRDRGTNREGQWGLTKVNPEQIALGSFNIVPPSF
jgi:hypothetical protein